MLTDASVGWMTERSRIIKLRAASSIFCFHYPHWYLNAAYAQLGLFLSRAEADEALAILDHALTLAEAELL